MAGASGDLPDVTALINKATEVSKQYEKKTPSCGFKSEFREVQLDEFRSTLQTLRRKDEFWKRQIKKYSGFKSELAESNFDVNPVALAALRVLQEEQRRARKLEHPFLIGACLTCNLSRRDFDFPVHMTEALQSVIDAFSSMPKPSKASRRKSFSSRLDMSMKFRQTKVPFGPEKRYIPLRRTATKIRHALENPTGPQVVLLHGGPGSGKSSLARYLALHYQKAYEDYSTAMSMQSGRSGRSNRSYQGSRKNSSVGPSEQLRESFRKSGATVNSQGSNNSGASSIMSESMLLYGCRFPGGVFYVPCTDETNIVDMQLQLLQDLGFTPPIGRLSHLTPEEIHNRLQDKLMEYLGKKDALVIIDNAWDPRVIRKLFLRGTKVRYLLTTHDPKLCEDEEFESVAIPIEKLRLETARKILSSHPPLLAPEAQEVLDAIITATGANPAALMHASMTILHKDDVEEWKELRNNLEALYMLSTQQGDGSLMTLFPREVPRNIGCSMTLALESLPLGVEKVLVALAALEGPSVPQVVVQLMLKCMEGNLGSFSRGRNVLEDRAMIRLHHHTVWWSSGSSGLQTTRWYIDALLQRFIQVRKAKAVASMIDSLFDRCTTDNSSDHATAAATGFADSDYTLTVALCAVYGSPSVADQAASKLGASVHRDDLAKIWAAPLVSLFQATDPRSKDEKRRQEIHFQARQVFLAYVYSGNPDKGMRGLLSSPAAVRPACWSVAWAVPNPKRALFARSGRTLRGLVNLIGRGVSADLLECATAALWNVSMASETKAVVARSPGLLGQVVRLLGLRSGSGGETLKRHAAGIVASLASEKENQERLVEFPGLLSNLVVLLTDYASTNVQVYAAHALMHLASASANKEVIVGFPGALEGLIELMHGGASVHEIAVGAVMNLSTDPDSKPVIAKFPGTLDGLVKLMAESPSALAQKRAAATLLSLSSTRKFLAIRLFPGVLEKLVGLLAKMDHPDLQEISVKILGNLAMVEENAGVIANFPGAWRGLLRLLREDVLLDVKLQALDTIGLLAAAAPTSKVGTSGVGRATQELLSLLGAHRHNPNFDILEKALLAIFRILDKGDNGKSFVAISKYPGALYQLVYLLGRFEFPELQETAVAVLASLAKWKQNRMVITHCPRALQGLVDLLADDRVKPSVQASALKTLWHVAYREDENRRMISEFPFSLQRIVDLLEKDAKPPSVQVCAALVLSTLAGVEGDVIDPEEIPGVLEILGALLTDEDVSPGVQQEVAKARTLLDWESTNQLSFTSSDAYAGRGRANAQLGMLTQALADFDVALREMWDMNFTLQKDCADDESVRRELQGNSGTLARVVVDADQELEMAILHGKMAHVMSNQAYVRTILKDYQAALRDADSALELQPQDSILWQERGVLKRLMGNLPGAMADFETSLQIAPDDYETLKHYGYGCFLRDDLTEAYSIAEHALEIDLDQGYDPPDGDEYCRLGKLPVSYLDFILR